MGFHMTIESQFVVELLVLCWDLYVLFFFFFAYVDVLMGLEIIQACQSLGMGLVLVLISRFFLGG